MAYLLRLMVASLALFASTAFAVIPLVFNWGIVGGGTGSYTSAGAACQASAAWWTSAGSYGVFTVTSVVVTSDGLGAQCNLNRRIGEQNYPDATSVERIGNGSCPENSNSNGQGGCVCATNYEDIAGSCVRKNVCPEGQVDQGGACVPRDCEADESRVNGLCVKDPDCPEGQTKINGKCEPKKCQRGQFAGEYKFSNTNPSAFCEGGCQVSVTSFVTAKKDGKIVDVVGMGYYTGSTCSGPDGPPSETGPSEPPDPDNPPDPDDPPGGGGDGGDGGNPGGGGQPGQPGQPGNPGEPGKPGDPGDNPGSKCPNGNCTGTEGGASTPGGEPTGPDGDCPPGYYKAQGKCWEKDPPPTEPDTDGKCPAGKVKAGDKCVPYQPAEDSDEKKDPSAFGGACGGFTCKGDAIQCAIAREQHVRNCQLFFDKSPESDLYNLEKVKTGNRTLELPGNETIDINNRIDFTDVLGGGAGVQDLNITVMRQSITLPLSVLNNPLAMLGNLLVAVSVLLAFRIVGRG